MTKCVVKSLYISKSLNMQYINKATPKRNKNYGLWNIGLKKGEKASDILKYNL